MVAFKSGPRPPGSEARKAKSKKFMDKITGDKKDPNDVIIKKEKPTGIKSGSERPQIIAINGIEYNKKLYTPEYLKQKQKEQRQEKYKDKFLKGGRAGFKSGSKGCKLAMKGKGRAYGKNS